MSVSNDDGRDNSRGPWIFAFPVCIIITGTLWFSIGIDWESMMAGLALGCTLAGWSIERTGNKVPESWRSNPSRTRRP